MTPLEIFRLVADEFSALPDADIEKWIAICKPLVSRKVFGETYDQALALLAAHRMKMAGLGDDGGAGGGGGIGDSLKMSSVSEGKVSVSYNAGTAAAATTKGGLGELALTVYGLQFIELRAMMTVSIVSAGES